MNALSPDLRAFVQQGVLTLPQAAGMMGAVQPPPPPDNAAAVDGHEETKEGEEEEDRGHPPPAPKPIKVTRALLVAFAREHLCLLYTSPSPRDKRQSRMPSSA